LKTGPLFELIYLQQIIHRILGNYRNSIIGDSSLVCVGQMSNIGQGDSFKCQFKKSNSTVLYLWTLAIFDHVNHFAQNWAINAPKLSNIQGFWSKTALFQVNFERKIQITFT